MILIYLETVLISLPLVIAVSGFAGWGLDIIQLLALTALYVSSSMAIQFNSWRRISASIRNREEHNQDDR